MLNLASISHLKVIGVACGVWIGSWLLVLLPASGMPSWWGGYAAWVGLKASLPSIVLVFSYAIDCQGISWTYPARAFLHAAYWIAITLVFWISLEVAKVSVVPEDAGVEGVAIDIVCLVAFIGCMVIEILRGLMPRGPRPSPDPADDYDHAGGLELVRSLARTRSARNWQSDGSKNSGQPVSPESISNPLGDRSDP